MMAGFMSLRKKNKQKKRISGSRESCRQAICLQKPFFVTVWLEQHVVVRLCGLFFCPGYNESTMKLCFYTVWVPSILHVKPQFLLSVLKRNAQHMTRLLFSLSFLMGILQVPKQSNVPTLKFSQSTECSPYTAQHRCYRVKDPIQREIKRWLGQLSSSLMLFLTVILSVTPEFQYTHRVQGLIWSQEQ